MKRTIKQWAAPAGLTAVAEHQWTQADLEKQYYKELAYSIHADMTTLSTSQLKPLVEPGQLESKEEAPTAWKQKFKSGDQHTLNGIRFKVVATGRRCLILRPVR